MKRLTSLFVMLFMMHFTFAQFNITGIVYDESSNPLLGANIQLKNTYLGSFSGLDGNFILSKVKTGKYELLVSYLGYEKYSQTIDLNADVKLEINLKKKNFITDEVIVLSTRAGNKAPSNYTNISVEELDKQNMGQDIPYLLSLSPSFVATSDAGTGIGYTNFRIRGTDMNRINVTLNGIPMNDAESHGVWWVDLPDFAESIDNIQIQRGVGTSTNGAASFGATINLQTTTLNPEPYAKIKSIAGSFNTFKNTVSVGSGLVNDHFSFDARLSKITSDGFIDRGWSDLQSYYLSGGYYSKKSILKLNVFSGLEETYQAWNGVPVEILDTNRTWNKYTYENQIDHYKQDYYQLHFSHEINSNLNLNMALHYTKGKGYYEQYKEGESFGSYGLDDVIIGNDTIEETDIIRRKWLDNDFYGTVFSMNYKERRLDFTFGGGWNQYDGDHFGKVIWSEYASNGRIRHEWYNSKGLKTDFNIYAKANYQLSGIINIFGDVQYRNIKHEIEGIDDDLRDLTQDHSFNFFNPKMGMYFTIDEYQSSYCSFAVANREPNRSNFVDVAPNELVPTSETLYDYEMGYKYSLKYATIGLNFFYMDYKDQLVLTGEINDVGSAIMKNVAKSYRTGIEIVGGVKINETFNWEANATLSKSMIKDFKTYVDNWDTWPIQSEFDLGDTELSFSPKFIANSIFTYNYNNSFSCSLISNYVSDQYIDNTADKDRKLDAYFVNNVRLTYSLEGKKFKNLSFQLLINNVLNIEYETNAWVYRYYSDDVEYKMDGYFPQAGTHFLGGITLKF